jgi:hypothetical protein
MNHSIYSADRATHSRIVAVALSAAIIVAGLATVSRVNSNINTAETAAVIKAGKPIALTRADGVVVAQ